MPPTDPRYPILSSLNDVLAPNYRYETGTSMAAPGVSGVLALMQEFFEQRLKLGYSPALLKALLINGARTVNPDIPKYDFSVTNNVKIQGWGLVNLTNSLPAALTNTDHTSWPLQFFDQSPTNTLSTGQRHTRKLGLSPDGQRVPLRVTLVWTDPPGNPGAGIKLVNDLDLVVTNLDTGEVFLGNGIPSGFSFNPPVNTNAPAGFDFANNVENVILRPPLGTNYSITVVGRRVNVNAVSANTNDVVQDYALVVACGDGELASPIVSLTDPVANVIPAPSIIVITNGVQLLHQRVGANFQLAPLPDGEAEQWRFYVFTNFFFTNTPSGLINGSNVAFITFPDGNLSLPRNLGPDIDLYVSADPALTNLNGAVVAGAFKSLNRGGVEAVVFTNAPVGPDAVFYIGVKSEDQQAADFGIVGFSSDEHFANQDSFGNHILRGLPPSAAIPDGSADAPGGVRIFAVDPQQPITISRVIVTNDIAHQSTGDLVGNLSYGNHFAVLNNHNRYGGLTNTFFHLVYDDSNSGEFYLSRPTDGPGSLNNFVGESTGSTMPWMFTMTDNSRSRTGRIESLNIRVEPNQSILGTSQRVCVLANQWDYHFVDVPPEGSKLTVIIANNSAPVDLYIKRGVQPTATDFDKFALINPPGGSLSIGLGDVPPLNAGRYFIGVFNPNASTECFDISSIIDQNPAAVRAQTYLPTNSLSLLDDAITETSIVVTNNSNVADVQVGVRVDHARASDLVFHLVSPQGTRILLSENRGQDNTVGYGLGSGMSTNAITNVVGTIMEDGFEHALNANFAAGSIVSGWLVEQNNIDVLGPNLFNFHGPADTGTNFIDIHGDLDGIISTNLATKPGTSYRLSFAYAASQFATIPTSIRIGVAGATLLDVVAPPTGFTPIGAVWKTTSAVFTATSSNTRLSVESLVADSFFGVLLDTFKVEELSLSTPLLYTIFTENTNLTTTPIKFGIAPFASTNGLSTNLVYTNSFEAIRPDDYCAVTNFGAWQLYSNHVTVVSDVLQSHTGANYLKLNNGQVLLTLPTSPGRRYQLQHVFRRNPPDPSLVSWWPAEGDANDIVGTNDGALQNGVSFTNGMVGQAFSFDGVDDFVSFGNAIGNFGTNDFTVEFWIKTTSARVEAILAKRPVCGLHESFLSLRLFSGRVGVELEGDPAGNVHVGNRRVNDGIIHHIAVVRQSTNAALYVDGVLDMSNSTPSVTIISNNVPLIAGVDACVGVDGTAPFTGQLDEISIFTRALPLREIRAIYLAGITAGAGKCGAQTLQFSTPISWWPAEGNANDISDGNPGTLSGGVTFAGGLVGRAFNFGGTGGVRINNNANLNFQTNLTMETWVFPTILDGEMDTILYKEADTGNPEQYAMAIKGPLNISCPGGAIATGRFSFALVGVTGLPNEFCGWVDGGGIVPTNQWTHLAVTFDGSTARAFINGALTRTLTNLSGAVNVSSGSLWIGSRSPVITGPFPTERFNGLIDETALYDHALDSCEIRDIYAANVKGKYSLLGRPAPCPVNATVIVDDRLTNTFGSSDWRTWQTNLMRFSATQIGTPLRLIAHEPEMQFDTFELSELSSGNYYLPEESLNTLLGESALGTWTLEVWDNRLGALINPAPDLLSWQLQFIFSNTNPPAIPLTFVPPTTNVASVYNPNGVLVTNVVVGGQIRYFIVDVPRRATIATNLLTVLSGGGDLALWYNPDALPTANPALGDVAEDRNGILPALADETLLLNLTTPPVLRPGQRYYLGVTNKTIPSTNTFLISVAFDQTDTNLISVRTLTNGICYTATIPVTNALDYYQFNVSTNSTIVNFSLSPLNGDANLVVRRALPVPDPLPRPNTGKFDYISQNGGTTNDTITITADSQPVPLSPGIWYLGVFNMATNPVTYTICATESTNGFYNIIPLTNAIPLDYTIGAGSLLTNLFLFTIDQTNSAVLFELYNLNSDAELLGDLGTFPTPATAQFADLASPVKIGQIVVRTNDFFPTLNGNWYLAVDNLQNGNLTFTISAVVSTNGILTSRLPMTIAIGFAPPPDIGLQFTWYSVLGETYVIETSDDLVTWTLLDTIVAYGSYITYTDPAGGTQPYLFYRIRQVP